MWKKFRRCVSSLKRHISSRLPCVQRPRPVPSRAPRSHHQVASEPDDNELFRRLDAEAGKFEKEAFRYFVFVEVNRQSVDRATREKLFRDHGKKLAEPVLDLGSVFSTTREFSREEAVVRRWMRQNELPFDPARTPGGQLEDALLTRAERQAKEIVTRSIGTPDQLSARDEDSVSPEK